MNTKPAFIKYPQIPHLAEAMEIIDGDGLQVFEKLDGGNCQVRMSDGKLFCGSRANYLGREEYFRFPWFKDFNRWAMSNKSLFTLPKDLVVYGEFTSPHTVVYKPGFTNNFFLIDVYDIQSGKFVPYQDARKRLEDLGVDNVFFLNSLQEGRLSLTEAKELAIGNSDYSHDSREGIVIKDYTSQKFAKLWRTSVNPTKEGLIEEIKKTIGSLRTSGCDLRYPDLEHSLEKVYGKKPDKCRYPRHNPISYPRGDVNKFPMDLDTLSSQVYDELIKSGRLDVSLAEINDTIRRVTANKT